MERLQRWLVTCPVLATACLQLQAAAAVSLVADGALPAPARHGLAAVKSALESRGVRWHESSSWRAASGSVVLVAGLSGAGGEAAGLMQEHGVRPCTEPESLRLRTLSHGGRPFLLVVGGDARGLMYALLDVADRVRWAGSVESPFSEVRDVEEKPFAPERALSVYTFNRAYWESRFYDERYWTLYFDTLARNRFNSFVVIFGYENGGFLAPAYPYFFDVEGFPGVRMVGITPEQQQRNLAALNRLIELAHGRGLRVTLGLWDHIYRGGVQGGGIPGADAGTRQPIPGLVWGLTGENLIPYTQAALVELLRRVPGVDALQFRMHDESGLKASEQEAFWREVFQRMKREAPHLRLDLRAKGLPDSVIQSAVDTGVQFRITTKYWMEQMGLPFHPTHVNPPNQFDRRHSYADLLRHPQRYRLHWRLWNGGTARVLLWGDPDYARRFVESTRLYAGDGFEVNEPLGTKMEAQPHDAKPFELLAPAHRYTEFEFERYWHFFQVFGRLGYNPATPAEVWEREFERRFGPEAAPFVARGLHRASQVLPRIVAACYPYRAFPMTRGWAEKQRLGDLPAYARAEGSDIQQFASFDDEAQLLIAGGATARTRPPRTSQWFAQTAEEIQGQVTEARQRLRSQPTPEFESTVTDLRILANLALYHARRIPAAVSYRLFERTRDPRALDEAIAHEREAVAAWRQLVAAAGDFYANDLMMGVRGANLCGHWADELAALERGVVALEKQRAEIQAPPDLEPAPRYRAATGAAEDAPRVVHSPVATAPPDRPLTITATVSDASGVRWVHLRYRSVNQHQDYRTLPMLPTGVKDLYRAEIPARDIPSTWDLMYFIEVMDAEGHGRIHPDLNLETPYWVVRLQREPPPAP